MCGELLVRSHSRARTAEWVPSSISVAALAITLPEVAQAWLIIGPVIPGAPMSPATHGPP